MILATCQARHESLIIYEWAYTGGLSYCINDNGDQSSKLFNASTDEESVVVIVSTNLSHEKERLFEIVVTIYDRNERLYIS